MIACCCCGLNGMGGMGGLPPMPSGGRYPGGKGWPIRIPCGETDGSPIVLRRIPRLSRGAGRDVMGVPPARCWSARYLGRRWEGAYFSKIFLATLNVSVSMTSSKRRSLSFLKVSDFSLFISIFLWYHHPKRRRRLHILQKRDTFQQIVYWNDLIKWFRCRFLISKTKLTWKFWLWYFLRNIFARFRKTWSEND